MPCLEFRRVLDRKSTRLNSSHTLISYAVFCLKKKQRPILSDLYLAPVPVSSPGFVCVHAAMDLCFRLPPTLFDTPVLCRVLVVFFFFNDTATTEIYPLSLHDPLPIWSPRSLRETFLLSIDHFGGGAGG